MADAYLTPMLRRYLDGFFDNFDEKLRDNRFGSPRVEFMASDGGLVDADHFSGLKSILSGPAGGVVGYALTSWDEKKRVPIIGCAYFYFFGHPIFVSFVEKKVDSMSEGRRPMFLVLMDGMM